LSVRRSGFPIRSSDPAGNRAPHAPHF
jgi:hypothetical protein